MERIYEEKEDTKKKTKVKNVMSKEAARVNKTVSVQLHAKCVIHVCRSASRVKKTTCMRNKCIGSLFLLFRKIVADD